MVPTTHAAFDGTVKMTDPAPSGGGYVADVTGGLGSVIGGNVKLGEPGSSFYTFCLERNEYFNPGSSYGANVSYSAIGGGYSGGNPDPISMATAYLYSQFRAGKVSGLTTSTADEASRNDLQHAIWFLEGEDNGQTLYNQKAKDLVKYANDQLGQLGIDPQANANGKFGVVVLNLYTGDLNHPNQSQLAIAVPEPSTVIAGALLLLPFGASVLRTVRKNRAA